MSIEQAKKELLDALMTRDYTTPELAAADWVEKIDALIIARVLDALQGVPKTL